MLVFSTLFFLPVFVFLSPAPVDPQTGEFIAWQGIAVHAALVHWCLKREFQTEKWRPADKGALCKSVLSECSDASQRTLIDEGSLSVL